MGYQITYTLKEEELSSEFKPFYKNKNINELNNQIEAIKLELKLEALLSTSETLAKTIDSIQYKVRQYIFLLEDLAKHYIYDAIKTEGFVYFCGWQYSQDPEYEKNTIIKNITENICIQKLVVPTKDYFDNDEEFSRKCNEIDCILDYQEIVLEMVYSDFKKKYYEKSDEEQNKEEKE